jgi:hypothetical protein
MVCYTVTNSSLVAVDCAQIVTKTGAERAKVALSNKCHVDSVGFCDGRRNGDLAFQDRDDSARQRRSNPAYVRRTLERFH